MQTAEPERQGSAPPQAPALPAAAPGLVGPAAAALVAGLAHLAAACAAAVPTPHGAAVPDAARDAFGQAPAASQAASHAGASDWAVWDVPAADLPAASTPVTPVTPESAPAPTVESAPDPAPEAAPPDRTVLAERPDATVVRVGAVVAKAHPVSSVPDDLAVRLAVAAHPRLRGVLLPPLAARGTVAGRLASVWPYGQPVDPRHAHAAPWEEAAVLLARLHAVPWRRAVDLPGPLPPMRGPAKAARAMARLGGVPEGEDARLVRRAWRRLPAWARGEEPYRGRDALCHGDWHLGQLVRHPAPDGPWLLIDVDDLGAGDPAWDLARPAMWFAAGLLPPRTWARFLAAYRAAGGSAVPPEGDPWPRLDVPARALAVQTAAIALAKSARDRRPLDSGEQALLATCARIGQLQ